MKGIGRHGLGKAKMWRRSSVVEAHSRAGTRQAGGSRCTPHGPRSVKAYASASGGVGGLVGEGDAQLERERGERRQRARREQHRPDPPPHQRAHADPRILAHVAEGASQRLAEQRRPPPAGRPAASPLLRVFSDAHPELGRIKVLVKHDSEAVGHLPQVVG
eukprot:scaffold3273_cov126-Isochrysis_galbana.AAC.6